MGRSVGLPASISHLYVSPKLHQFLAKFPRIKIHIVHGNHLLDLLDNGFDLILHCGQLPDYSFHYKKLGVWKKICCAATPYIKRYGMPHQPSELVNYNCLDHADNFHYSWHFQEKNKLETIAVSGNVRINSSLDLGNLASSGLGIADLPSFTVYPQLKSGALVSILEACQSPPLPMYLVYPSRDYLEKKTKTFLNFMQELLAAVLEL